LTALRDDGDMAEGPFGDIPLFREIQKILSSSEGPINLEIARQVAGAIAAQAGPEASLDASAERAFDEATHAAEAVVSGYVRLPRLEPVRTKAVGRTWWAETTLEAWRWLLEHLAHRFTGELGRFGEGADHGANPLEVGLAQVAPLLVGIQTGTLLGHLSSEVLGRYDLPIPRQDDGQLFFVASNIDKVAKDYDFNVRAFRTWLAVHSVAGHLVMTSIPWTTRYLRSLLIDVVDAIEIDTADLERRFVDLQARGIEGLQEGTAASEALPIANTERHRKALDRLRAFVAIVDGYTTHAARAVMPQLERDGGRIDEGMGRYRASSSEGRQMLATILGISLDRSLESSGTTFCAAVVRLKDLASLNRLWDAPDNLPTIDEIKDPFVWMDRVLS
jgi:putative hydrolase